jgi:predicted metalloprotease with PDZ domain
MSRLFFFLFLVFQFTFSLQAASPYKYFVDLTKVTDDKLSIKLNPPEISGSDAEFCFPSIVPGTYSIYDFGRFVSDMKVMGKDGKEIATKKLDINRYSIPNPQNIDYITYKVEDSWDTKDTGDVVFEPAGTKFDEGKNFVLNNHGIFGYFKGQTKTPIDIEITKPENFYGATGLSDVIFGKDKDLFHVSDYHELVDSPIMYNIPDTTTIDVNGTKVLISVVSPTRKITSGFCARTMEAVLIAQKNYLGGKLPVSKYAFLFLFVDGPTLSGSNGALEHSYSSMYVLYEGDSLDTEQMIKDVAAHEFFHIVTPLNIHSEEIGNFDFNNPVMSQHLWLYEGMTEYAAHHMQVREGLISINNFFENIQSKMAESQESYSDTLPFTVMSKDVLMKYKKEYNNVYAKGALIGMCLDINLRYYSKGKYGTQDLMADLSKKYGKNTSFKDSELFSTIEKLTYPEIRQFLDAYVAGNKKLPYEDVFRKVGMVYTAVKVVDEISLGGIDVGLNPETGRLIIYNVREMNSFGKKMGYKEEDEIVSFNGVKMDKNNVRDLLVNFLQTAKAGDKLTIEVMRKDKKGREKLKVLKAKVIPAPITYRNDIKLDPNATSREILTRNTWLGLSGQ